MTNYDESNLDALFQDYRAALPDSEPDVHFMPSLWKKIEARRGFWRDFQFLARRAMAGGAALTLLLLALNIMGVSPGLYPSYTDALLADHSAEKTDYAESVRTATLPTDAIPVDR